MMILKLNLLSKKDKKKLKTISLVCWFKNIFINLIFILIIFNIFLFLIFIILFEQNNLLFQRSNEVKQGYQNINKEVEKINEQILLISKAGENFGLLTPRFWTLITTTPENIILKNINLSLEQKTNININGIAKDRNTVLNYEKTLANIPWVKNVTLPPSQLLQKENISFSIELLVEPPTIDEYF